MYLSNKKKIKVEFKSKYLVIITFTIRIANNFEQITNFEIVKAMNNA